MIRNQLQRHLFLLASLLILTTLTALAQSGSTRPRRATNSRTQKTAATNETTKPTDSLLDVEPANSGGRRRSTTNTAPAVNSDAPLLNTTASTPVAPVAGVASATSDTSHAFSLLQQKQYAAALKEARQITESNPNDSEGWKIAGFAEMNLKQYEAASADLQKALDLQRLAKQEDPFTFDGLAHAYYLSEKFDRALPLLVIASTRTTPKPEPVTIYYRGVAEYRTGKAAEAERTFNQIVKDNPKDSGALYFLGQIAFERNDFDTAIAALNRATLADSRSVSAWNLLTIAYLQRAAAATTPEKASADYLSAVRAGEGLTKVRTDVEANLLFAQALVAAGQYPRAATVLERFTTGANAPASALYLLGVAQSRAQNFPKAIAALERAATKTPQDANIYRELGYAYEISKQYAKALTAYEKGSALVPNDADFKASAERVRPYAK
ncbi:MAG TPA: tetratricopeptide repeat protein [Pyrinomonadaceae bacterium]